MTREHGVVKKKVNGAVKTTELVRLGGGASVSEPTPPLRSHGYIFILSDETTIVKLLVWSSKLLNSLLDKRLSRFRPPVYNILEEIAVLSCGPEDKLGYVW